MATPARTPEGVHAVLESAFNAGDLDAYTDVFDDDAALVVPPNGGTAVGREQIRGASEAIFALGDLRAEIRVLGKLEGNGLALTHARWTLAGTGPDGDLVELGGRGTIVSRRKPDGSWRIVLDNPLSPDE